MTRFESNYLLTQIDEAGMNQQEAKESPNQLFGVESVGRVAMPIREGASVVPGERKKTRE